MPYECPSKRAPENVPDATPDPPQTGSQKDPASRSQTRPKRSLRRHEKGPKEKPTSQTGTVCELTPPRRAGAEGGGGGMRVETQGPLLADEDYDLPRVYVA